MIAGAARSLAMMAQVGTGATFETSSARKCGRAKDVSRSTSLLVNSTNAWFAITIPPGVFVFLGVVQIAAAVAAARTCELYALADSATLPSYPYRLISRPGPGEGKKGAHMIRYA